MDNRDMGRMRKRRRLKRSVRRILTAGVLLIIALLIFNNIMTKDQPVTSGVTEEGKKEKTQSKEENSPVEPVIETIKISAAGDFTLGTDESFTYAGSFPDEASKNGLPYFVKKLDHIFEEDDLTTVNLETTLTNATEKAIKKFRFKGDPSYAQILELGGIEAVNLANNHTMDYLQQGYDDTITTLEKQKIGYFGYEHHYVTTIKGVKVGALGYEGWEDTPETRAIVDANIKRLREQGVQIVLIHFHWGIERSYVPTESQQSLARYAIDSGADLILGHHPHVVQGIEEYKGKFIVYSLGNFMFGGNRNPADKDTYVFQQTFHLKDGKLTDQKEIKVVPFSISSVTSRNNYQPLLLEGAEAERVKNKIIDVSNQINGSDWLQYETE
ncbi:CapA family protein [Bacillus sp. JJ634]